MVPGLEVVRVLAFLGHFGPVSLALLAGLERGEVDGLASSVRQLDRQNQGVPQVRF